MKIWWEKSRIWKPVKHITSHIMNHSRTTTQSNPYIWEQKISYTGVKCLRWSNISVLRLFVICSMPCWFSRQLISSMKKADNLFLEGLSAPTMPWGSAPKCPGCDRTVYPMEQVPSFWILWNLTSFLGSHETCCHFLDPMEQVVIFLDPMEYVFIFGIS